MPKTKKTKKRKNKKAKPKPKPKKTAKPQKVEELVHRTRMRVIGIGGGGSSIISEIAPQLNRVDFIAANTDLQALKEVTKKARVFHFGQNLTHGLGCGMDQKLGQGAARGEKQKIAKLFRGIDLAILVASLGGGTGSGASPEFAKIARELGVMTFGIFTLPFRFEGVRRAQIARASLEKLTPNLNAVSVIPNENIFKIIDKNTSLKKAFSAINKRLAANLRGLIETIYLPGLINVDFADLKTILEGKGSLTYLNSAIAQGANRAGEAVKEVLKSPLNEYSIQGAQKIIFNITASQDLGMKEVEEISQTISDFNRRAKIIFGVSQDNNYKDKLRITLLAVGCGKKEPDIEKKPEPPKKKPEPPKKKEPKPLSSEARRAKEEKPKPKPRLRRGFGGQAKIKSKTKIKIKTKKPTVHTQEPISENQNLSSNFTKQDNNLTNPETWTLNKTPIRRNALDLKKEIEKTEQDLFEQEKRWDIPAFLRRKMEN